jgi:hypothetical protein
MPLIQAHVYCRYMCLQESPAHTSGAHKIKTSVATKKIKEKYFKHQCKGKNNKIQLTK